MLLHIELRCYTRLKVSRRHHVGDNLALHRLPDQALERLNRRRGRVCTPRKAGRGEDDERPAWPGGAQGEMIVGQREKALNRQTGSWGEGEDGFEAISLGRNLGRR